MVNLFEQIEEGVKFAEAANTQIPVGKVVNIAYLLILRTGGMEKACEQWEDIQLHRRRLLIRSEERRVVSSCVMT